MSRFNDTATKRAVRAHDSVNRAGAPAYKQSDKAALVAMLLTSFVKDQYYRSGEASIQELRDLVGKVDPEFAAKAAIYARNEFGMRSITHVVGAEIPALVKGEKWTKRFINEVVRRPDDATEILSLYLATYGKPIPNSLKKGLSLALGKFDSYQLSKYRASGKGTSLVDLVNLVHAKPSEKNARALQDLVEGTLKSKDTWEARLSSAGKSENKEEAKSEAWADLLAQNKLGYFAALRNIRNVITQAPDQLDALLAVITDEGQIKKSLVLPFRYITALDAIEKESFDTKTKNKITKALNRALDVSFANVPEFEGETLVAIDRSASMTGGHYYGRGGMTNTPSRAPIDYAVVFAAAMLKKNDADLMLYESDAKYLTGINPADSFTTILKQIRQHCNGGGTDVSSVFRRANKKYDRILILSDNESWRHNRYAGWGQTNNSPAVEKAAKQPKAFVYAMDLAGYGDLSFAEQDRKVANIAGFSEKVFDMFKLLEQDPNALVKKIESVDL